MKFQSRTFQLLTTIGLSIGLSASLQAADARFCDNYAKTAVKQQIGNVSQDCAEKGSRWSSSYIGHKAWCMGASKANASKESEARSSALGSCGADSYKINWNTLPNIPTVWDKLFVEMLEATKKDDVEAVKTMLGNGVNIRHDYQAKDGTILYHAVDLQAEKTALYLLSQKANTKATSKGGANALSKMIEDKSINYRLLGALLKGGFDPNYAGQDTSDMAFPLLIATKKNDYAAVQMLLQAGANPNLKRTETPLLYAVANRNMSMVQLLLKSGANPNLSSAMSSCLPLDKAIKSGSRSVIEFLKTKGAKTAPNCR